MDDQTVRDLIRRAQEIESQGLRLREHTEEAEMFVRAAEEAGVPRSAAEQALRERLSALESFTPGSKVFARSADGFAYIASVVGSEGGRVRVRFLTGTEARVPLEDIEEINLSPGAKMGYFANSMWWTGKVLRANLEGGSITLEQWGQEETVPLEKVRLPRRARGEGLAGIELPRGGALAAIVATTLVSGGVLGALITWILMR